MNLGLNELGLNEPGLNPPIIPCNLRFRFEFTLQDANRSGPA